MLRRFLFAGIVCLLSLSGCKSGSLAAREAAAALSATAFAPPAAVQTISFTEGESRTPKADAINSYLYAKHWLECKDTQPGLFSRVTVCTLDAAGRTFGRENGWTDAHVAGTCAQCRIWTVPLARAMLRSVSDVEPTDKTHAVATYAYDVTPNSFGGGLNEWMSKNSDAWCGADPRAAGLWGQPRTGKATFTRNNGTWSTVPAGNDFAAVFGAPAPDRPCAAP